MRYLILFILFTSTTVRTFSQSDNPNYNDSLAKLYNADDYGMKNYFFVLLSTGDNKTTTPEFLDSCFRSHMNNINLLVDEKKLIVAGPFGKNDAQMRGLFIINAENEEEVLELLKNDAAVEEGILKAQIVPWYGSAALPAYLEVSDQVWKKAP